MPTAEQYWRDREKCRARNHEWYLKRKRNHVPGHRPAVEIIDPKVADPYYITKTEFEANRQCFMAGTVAVIDGIKFVL